MTDQDKAFYVLDFITDLKALCEKSENLNGVFKKKQKQVFNNFHNQARFMLDHIEKTLDTEDKTFDNMLDFKYDIMTELKLQYNNNK